jgi:hypothetical protein
VIDWRECTRPAVKATGLLNSFLKVAEAEFEIRADAVQGTGKYRTCVQHPASHASAELCSCHLETRVSGAAGALFHPERVDTSAEAMNDSIKIAHLLAGVLDRATDYLATH